MRRTTRTLHLTDWGRVLLEKLIVICMVQKFPIFSITKIYCYITVLHPYPMTQQPLVVSLLRLHDHTQTHHTWYDSSGWVISPTQRPLPENTQHTQRDRHPCHQWDSSLQFQQVKDYRPTPLTTWPLGLATLSSVR